MFPGEVESTAWQADVVSNCRHVTESQELAIAFDGFARDFVLFVGAFRSVARLTAQRRIEGDNLFLAVKHWRDAHLPLERLAECGTGLIADPVPQSHRDYFLPDAISRQPSASATSLHNRAARRQPLA
jgi:hypothetical protein